jgi:branched-chain amino acid transport system ATP-binding protein
MSSDALLALGDLHVSYGAIAALRGVSLEVRQGEIVTLIGSNGAGKSTTLRTVSGLLRPVRGSVTFDGQDITGMAPHLIVRRGLSHCPEGRGIFPELTVDENLSVGLFGRADDLAGADRDRERALTLFPRLRERIAQRAGTLSGGEQQMLAIGRALLARPRLLLLDEPSLGLAPQVVQTIFRIVREINEGGTTVLLVEQNARLALGVAHRGYVMETGRIVLSDEAKALAESDAVRKAYLGG